MLIAEPYRQALIPKFNEVRQHAAMSGALATGISGSGPTVFVAMTDKQQALRMKEWLETNFIQNEDGFCHVCKIDRQGTQNYRTRTMKLYNIKRSFRTGQLCASRETRLQVVVGSVFPRTDCSVSR